MSSDGQRVVGGYVDSDWGQVHYRRSGNSGPAVVLFHESPLSSAVFERVLPVLGRSARAVAFDTPGYGASAPPAGPGFEIPEYARVLARAVTALDLSDPVLAGVHTGASIALEVDAALPGGAAGLVLSGVALFSPQERRRYVDAWTPPVPVDGEGTQFTWGVERYRRIWGPDVSPDLLHLAVVELMRVAERYDWGYQAAFRHDPAGPLAATAAPVLLLDAEFDLLADKDALAMDLARRSELVVLPGLPGQPHLRAPAEYARELLRFAGQVTAGRRDGARP